MTATETQIIKFEVGQTYQTRSTCDHECIYSMTVASRTAKQIVTTDGKRLGIAKRETEWNGAETVFPDGRYSMAPTFKANRKLVTA